MRDDFNKAAYDLENAVDTIGDGLKIAARAVSDFGERTGNLFTDGHFASDEEVAEIQARERIQEAIKNGTALEDGSAEYNRMMAALYGNPNVNVGKSTPGEMSQAEYMQRFRDAEQRAKNQDLATNWQDRAINQLEANEMGYLKGFQKWVKGDGYNNVSMVQGADGEYYEVKRMVNPKDGTITVVGDPTKITDENVINQYKKDTKNPTTWCNYAANEFAQEFGAPSLVYRSDIGEFGATKLGKYLENGTLNNSNGQFVEVPNHMDASNLASRGNLVLMVGAGHVATLTGGYSGEANIRNLNIFQAGAQDRNSGRHMFGGMKAVDGWGNKRIKSVKMYTWRSY